MWAQKSVVEMVERLVDSMVEYLVMARVVEMVELKAEKKVIEAVGGLDPPEHSQQRRGRVDSDSDEDNNSFE